MQHFSIVKDDYFTITSELFNFVKAEYHETLPSSTNFEFVTLILKLDFFEFWKVDFFIIKINLQLEFLYYSLPKSQLS